MSFLCTACGGTISPGMTHSCPSVRPMVTPSKHPYLCPVCDGRGTVPPGFYGRIGSTAVLNDEQCRTCGGAGVLWG